MDCSERPVSDINPPSLSSDLPLILILSAYPLSDRQFESTITIMFGRQSSRCCEYCGRRIFGLSAYGMVKIRFIPPWPNSVLCAFFRPGQSVLKFFVSGGQRTPITLFYAWEGHRIHRFFTIRIWQNTDFLP